MTDREKLAVALAGVPSGTRRALELAVIGGLGYREIAARLGESEMVVAGLLRDGLLQLRTYVGGRDLVV